MKIQWTLIFALIFALLTAIFAVINVEPVSVNFLFTITSTPLILVILSSTLLGGLIVGLFGIIRQFKQQRTIRQLERQLEEAKRTAGSTPDTGARSSTDASGQTVDSDKNGQG
jgi:lipopolysaccharide assembly protein A